MADSMDRAIELSLKLNNSQKIESARKKTMQLLESLQTSEKFRFCLELSESLLEMKDKIDKGNYARVMSILESGVNYYQRNNNFHLMRSFLGSLIKYTTFLGKNDVVQKCRKEIASSFEVEGDQRIKESGLIASHFYEESVEAFKSLGETDKVGELLTKLKEASRKAMTEMKVIEVPIKIPTDYIEQIVEEFTSYDPQKASREALEKIATSQDLMASFVNARRLAEEIRKKYPVSFIFPRKHFRQANPIAKSVDDEAILDDHTVQYFSWGYRLRMELLLCKILDKLEEKGLTSSSLISYLSSSKVYDSEDLSIIKIGFDRYFDHDYVSAIHILIPQLENVLRHLLEKLGEPVSKVKGDIIIEQPLDDILRNQRMAEFLGEDVFYYFKTFLVDHREENLRHEIAHGLLNLESCTKRNVVTIIHQFLILTRFKLPSG